MLRCHAPLPRCVLLDRAVSARPASCDGRSRPFGHDKPDAAAFEKIVNDRLAAGQNVYRPIV